VSDLFWQVGRRYVLPAGRDVGQDHARVDGALIHARSDRRRPAGRRERVDARRRQRRAGKRVVGDPTRPYRRRPRAACRPELPHAHHNIDGVDAGRAAGIVVGRRGRGAVEAVGHRGPWGPPRVRGCARSHEGAFEAGWMGNKVPCCNQAGECLIGRDACGVDVKSC